MEIHAESDYIKSAYRLYAITNLPISCLVLSMLIRQVKYISACVHTPRTWIHIRPGITSLHHRQTGISTEIIPTIREPSHFKMASHFSSGLPPLSDHEYKLYNRMADKMQSLVRALSAAFILWTVALINSTASMVSCAMEHNLRRGSIITTPRRHVYQELPQLVFGIL